MKVYVAPCGIGLGHITRCEPIAKELIKQGHDVVVSTYSDGLEYAQNNGFTLMKSYPIGFRVREDGAVDFKLTAATSGFSLGIRRFLRQLRQEIRNLQSYRPDIVLSDSRASSLLAARMMCIPVVLLLNQYRVDIIRKPSERRIGPLDRFFYIIANLSWVFLRTLLGGVWGRSNRILIPDYPPPRTISASNLTIPKRYHSKVQLIGPILRDNPGAPAQQEKFKRLLGFEPSETLVYAAVSGPKIERRFLAKLLRQELLKLPTEYAVVLSLGEPGGSRIPVRNGNVTEYGWIEDQLSILNASDVLICRAGHGTITKAIALRIPMVLIPIPDHTEQYGNAKRVQALGFGKMIHQKDVKSDTLLEAVRTLIERRNSGDGFLLSNDAPNGIQQALDAISIVAQRN
jgi:UDP:flavonoid glycosyltransferase YjiC (YdhE family)